MTPHRMQAHVVLFVFAALLPAAAAQNTNKLEESASTKGSDLFIKPGDDFYRYANGSWLRTTAIPAGQQSYDTRAMLVEKTRQRVRDLIEDAATAQVAMGSLAYKIGAFYTSFMDEDAIEAKKLKPLADELAVISAIRNKASLSAYLGTTLNSEVEGITANADHILGVWVNQGFQDSDHNLPHLLQGGLGMPDRDAYITPSPEMARLRAQYQAHIAATLKLANVADSETRAAHVLSLEIRIAEAHAPDADAADVFKQNNPWRQTDLRLKAPGMDWDAYLTSAGLAGQSSFMVWQPSAVAGTSALVNTEGLDVWKDYLEFHLIEHYASVLPKALAAEDSAFYGTILSRPILNRNQGAIAATNGALGQAVGQLYTQHYFSAEAKAKAQAVVANLRTVYHARIANLAWMSPQTKEKALAKLATLELGVGYPDVWIDYATLDVVRGDAFGNMRRAEAFNRSRGLAKLRQAVDPVEWPIDPQTPGAVLMFSPNAEFFSAAILQPPFFDSQGDDASNYGSAGAGIAHEISHSFDELGAIYDAHGRLGNWWTAEDLTRYHAATAKLAAQFDGYCPIPGLCVNGKLVLGENIADLAGLMAAHDAYLLSLKGKTDIVLGGLSGEQRFFLAFSQRWRRIQGEAALRRQITTDHHAPGEYRSNTVRNIDAWYKAYEIAPGDKLYLKPEERVEIW